MLQFSIARLFARKSFDCFSFSICHFPFSSFIFARYLRHWDWCTAKSTFRTFSLLNKQQCCTASHSTSWSVCSIKMHKGKLYIEAQALDRMFMHLFGWTLLKMTFWYLKMCTVNRLVYGYLVYGYATMKTDKFFFFFLFRYWKMQVSEWIRNESSQIIILLFIRQIYRNGNEMRMYDVRYCVSFIFIFVFLFCCFFFLFSFLNFK